MTFPVNGSFAAPSTDLANPVLGTRDVAVAPSPGQGLALDETGVIPIGAHGLVPRAQVYRTTAQAITNTTLTAVAFDNESYDTNGMHDTVTNNSRLTCHIAGVYLVAATIVFATNAAGHRGVGFQVNGGGTYYGWNLAPNIGAVYNHVVNAAWLIPLAPNDFVEAWVYQTSGGGLNVGVADGTTGANNVFQATWVGNK